MAAAPAAHLQHAAAAPTPQPAAQPEAAMQQAHIPGEAAAEVEEAEDLVAAAAEAVVVKQEVEGTEDTVAAAEVAIKREATRPGNADGKRRACGMACGTPGCPFPDQHAGACPSLRAEGKRKRRLPAALAEG